MGHENVSGAGLRTRYEGEPNVAVICSDDGVVSVRLRYQSAPSEVGEEARFTVVEFLGVVEYRWIAFNQSYFLYNEDDYDFSLIRIVRSDNVSALLGGENRGQTLAHREGVDEVREQGIVHYRIGFDDYGTFDVICSDLSVTSEVGISE